MAVSYADNGFGEMVRTDNPFGEKTQVYTMDGKKLAQFTADTGRHDVAIAWVRQALGHTALGRGRWDGATVLAAIPGGRQ